MEEIPWNIKNTQIYQARATKGRKEVQGPNKKMINETPIFQT